MFFPDFEFNTWLGLSALVVFYVVGVLHVLHALMHVRTSQGTIAWVVSLLSIPFLAIPMYWLLGRTRFSRKVGGRRENDSNLNKLAGAMRERLRRETARAFGRPVQAAEHVQQRRRHRGRGRDRAGAGPASPRFGAIVRQASNAFCTDAL